MECSLNNSWSDGPDLRKSFLNKVGFLSDMPRGQYKSKTFRRVFVRTPGSKTVLHYRTRKPSKAICGSCKQVLLGVARQRPTRMQNIPKTQKRPERPFGGVLCGGCMRKQFVALART